MTPRASRSAWTLRRRVAAALAAASLLLAGLVAVSGVVLLRVRHEQQRVVNDLFEGFSISDRLFEELLDSESAARIYVLTGDPSHLERYRPTRNDGAARYAELRRVIAGQPRLESSLDRAVAAATAWRTQWADPTVEAVQRGSLPPGKAALGQESRLFSAVRSDYETYRSAYVEERAASLRHLNTLTTEMFAGILLAAAGAFVLGVGLWIFLRRWVLLPVEQLAAETRQVSSGHLEHEVGMHGPPEFVGLAADVEAMRRGLLSQLSVLQAAKAEVERGRARLEEQAADLQRSNEELEQFAYVASHDLQEPLRKVASFCQILERRYKGQLDERADQYIAFAVDGAKRMQQLINDLLAFSRVGRLRAGWAEVPLQRCLDSALRNLESAVEESGAEVTSDPLPVVQGEAALLTQVFQNLVGNALKFRGGEPPRVHLGVRRDGEHWEFCCADNGIGVEPQYAERIFVIFQRLHPKDEYEGTGIGLAMCKKIIEYHGGHIWLDTGDGAGTIFRWTLPALQAAPRPAGDAAVTPGTADTGSPTPRLVEVAHSGGTHDA